MGESGRKKNDKKVYTEGYNGEVFIPNACTDFTIVMPFLVNCIQN